MFSCCFFFYFEMGQFDPQHNRRVKRKQQIPQKHTLSRLLKLFNANVTPSPRGLAMELTLASSVTPLVPSRRWVQYSYSSLLLCNVSVRSFVAFWTKRRVKSKFFVATDHRAMVNVEPCLASYDPKDVTHLACLTQIQTQSNLPFYFS